MSKTRPLPEQTLWLSHHIKPRESDPCSSTKCATLISGAISSTPANGVLEAGRYRIFRIPAGCKQEILEHLSANCAIRMDTASTYSQSWFEAQKFNRLNRNSYMLGLTMEWLGETGQAKRIYSSLGHSAVPDSTIRLLELRGETGGPFTEQDA